MADVIVVGAGISGLVCAYELRKARKNVLLLEAGSSAGGKIGSERIDGYLLESGPNSLRLDNQETRDLITEIGLQERMLEASPNAKRRFILRHGAWVEVPSSPPGAISTSLFSVPGKLRVLAEPLIAKSVANDESVASFFTRRFGREVYRYAVDPFVTGIYAGDPERLSVRHAFPKLWEMEQRYGSVIKGALRSRKSKTPSPRQKSQIISFPEGLGEITSALTSALKTSIKYGVQIRKAKLSHESIVLISANGESHTAKEVILTSPAMESAAFFRTLDPVLSSTLRSIEYPTVAVAYLGYKVTQFAKPIAGFGGLIPSSENRKILGVIYSSSNFTDRAPEGIVLLTVLLGGARNADARSWSQQEVIRIAESEIDDLYKADGKPVFSHSKIWQHAIPQYNIGYETVHRELSRAESEYPGLHFLGNYRSGISVGACIRNATELAKRLV